MSETPKLKIKFTGNGIDIHGEKKPVSEEHEKNLSDFTLNEAVRIYCAMAGQDFFFTFGVEGLVYSGKPVDRNQLGDYVIPVEIVQTQDKKSF